MIEDVRITNLGVIESAQLTLGAGMTALTGETGAGKTMALTSLALLTGGKADASKVRAGEDEAIVEGTFVVGADSPAVAIVEGAGGACDIDAGQAIILVRRHVPRNGRSRAYVGGRAVPIGLLKELSSELVTVHGQTDQLRLKSATQQRGALDEYGGAEIARALSDYTTAWQGFRTAEDAVAAFNEKIKSAGAERLALDALVKRVDAVKPEEGEDDDLRAEARRLDNVESLREAMHSARYALNDGEESAAAQIDQAIHSLRRAAGDDPELAPLAERLESSVSVLSDVAAVLGQRLEGLDADPDRLEWIHERRATLKNLVLELGMEIPEILERREAAEERLAELVDPTAHAEKLQHDLAKARKVLVTAGNVLTKVRSEYAVKLGKAVTRELASLAMKDAIFSVELTAAEPSSTGMDAIDFYLTPHRGADPLPLAKSASGGEISRIMLALEVTLAGTDTPANHTFIFDEVDAGIGGKTALAVGERLARMARQAQVLVVTHLAQVAAYANAHVVVEKAKDTHTTRTNVRHVSEADRERELARMLSGHDESDTARTHAAELLQAARVG